MLSHRTIIDADKAEAAALRSIRIPTSKINAYLAYQNGGFASTPHTRKVQTSPQAFYTFVVIFSPLRNSIISMHAITQMDEWRNGLWSHGRWGFET